MTMVTHTLIRIQTLEQLIDYRKLSRVQVARELDMTELTFRLRIKDPMKLNHYETDKLQAILEVSSEQLINVIHGKEISI